MTHPFRFVNDPAARERLMDPAQVRDAYAQGTIKTGGRSLGAGQKAFERALDLHGIPRRKRGEKAPGRVGLVLTREQVRRLVYRAYANSDRCPPDCIGRATCLDDGARCVLGEL